MCEIAQTPTRGVRRFYIVRISLKHGFFAVRTFWLSILGNHHPNACFAMNTSSVSKSSHSGIALIRFKFTSASWTFLLTDTNCNPDFGSTVRAMMTKKYACIIHFYFLFYQYVIQSLNLHLCQKPLYVYPA